jgi:type II secretory pathway component GspD/PulD (secretin)
MVLISTVVGELTLNDSKEFGVDYILRNSGVLGGTTTTTPGTDGTPGATQGTRIVGFTDGSPIIDLNALLNRSDIRALSTLGSGGVSGFITAGSAFNAVVRALESNNRFKVISRPSIFTSNNRQASIRAGEEVPVPTNIQSSFGSANTNVVSNSNIQFKPVELELQVSPVINSEDEVTLEIVQNISERAGSQRIDNNDIPIISRRALKTVVTVPNESMLVLGGLIRGTTNHTKGGIPLLNRVPLVGPLFGNAQKETRRSELVVIMRTSVTHSAMQTQSIRERFYGSPTLDPDLTKNVFAEPPPPPSRQPAAVATAVAASSAAPRGTAVEATKGATGTTGTKGVPVPTAAKAQEQRGTRKPVTPTGAYRK